MIIANNNYTQDPQKHLQIARIGQGNTKKRRNKKADESITPIRYNVIHIAMYVKFFWW